MVSEVSFVVAPTKYKLKVALQLCAVQASCRAALEKHGEGHAKGESKEEKRCHRGHGSSAGVGQPRG